MNTNTLFMKRISLLLVFALAILTACAPKQEQTRVQKALAALHDPSSKYVVVAAHRGDWRGYPENSIQAIESCIRMGVDMMELDLKLTKDSVLVLSHDHTLNRCTTGSGPISEYTYEEILRFDLEVCKDRILVNVDQGYEYYDLVLALTEELGVTDQILIKSGRELSEVKDKLNQYPHRLMYMPVVGSVEDGESEVFREFISYSQPQLAYELCFNKLNDNVKNAAAKVISSGSKIWVNTIWESLCGGYDDDAADSAEDPGTVYGPILELGASILQTDRPALLISYLESIGRH